MLANEIKKSKKPFHNFLSQANINSLFMTPTSAEEIKNIVNIFKIKPADGISNKLLKKVIKEISKPLAIILINQSWKEKYLWK